MIKNYLAALLIILCTTAGLAQTDTTYWRKSLSTGANINQSSFSDNWKAGGVNSIALSLFLNAKANYLKDKISWDNASELQYGLIKNAKQDMRKSLDRIFLDSKVGYKLSGHWNAFVSGNFITQFGPGYIYDTDAAGSDSLISAFMAPGFLTFALGFEYKPVPWFSLRLSPFAPRFTFLTNDAVAENQRYGVPVGKTIRTEWLAAMVQADLEKDIATNLNLKVNYLAYANYETLAFNTIDHRISTTLTAKVNRFISVNLTGILLYDRDQDTDVQLSQTLGLGILYNVQNFTDPK
ncbi:DUF3078 domain-containing protein [Rhodocytophaga rosea]|uniref:DUF3078 domain-containing protein n=1 Tax=Rhodocytophaga rosea TaxID=2704465 RepID=A0A6C0GNU5_9BACT|nr:DUF3078 domain-containing protein [Rhodocytophaga rosea]QHT69718.1 DUF3078 domain-containing protein [Rhodocytophaga rosea]